MSTSNMAVRDITGKLSIDVNPNHESVPRKIPGCGVSPDCSKNHLLKRIILCSSTYDNGISCQTEQLHAFPHFLKKGLMGGLSQFLPKISKNA